MNIKKFLITTAAGALMLGAMITPAFATTPNWDITGNWSLDFDLGGGHYRHTMTVINFDPSTGAFSGTGVYNLDELYIWTVTGIVSGNNITYHILYTGTGAGYYSDATGTITSSTSMIGTWSDINGASGTWTGTGTAKAIVGSPTSKDQCKDEGWMTFNDPTFKNQGDCVSFVAKNSLVGKATGGIQMSSPSQQMEFSAFDYGSNSTQDKGSVEYWNYEYPGILHYIADVICATVDKVTKDARFMFQIPAGWPGLTGLYVLSAVHDGGTPRANGDTYGHSATDSLSIALDWCENGTPVTNYSIVGGNLTVH